MIAIFRFAFTFLIKVLFFTNRIFTLLDNFVLRCSFNFEGFILTSDDSIYCVCQISIFFLRLFCLFFLYCLANSLATFLKIFVCSISIAIVIDIIIFFADWVKFCFRFLNNFFLFSSRFLGGGFFYNNFFLFRLIHSLVSRSDCFGYI